MMQSSETIISYALILMGERQALLNQEESKASRLATALFENVCNRELSLRPWRFALRHYELPSAFMSQWYEQRPDDCLKPVMAKIGRHYLALDHIQRKDVIGDEMVTIIYITNQVQVSAFPPSFVEALALRLAMTLCEVVTQSPLKVEALRKQYAYLQNQLRHSQDWMRMPVETEHTTSWQR